MKSFLGKGHGAGEETRQCFTGQAAVAGASGRALLQVCSRSARLHTEGGLGPGQWDELVVALKHL